MSNRIITHKVVWSIEDQAAFLRFGIPFKRKIKKHLDKAVPEDNDYTQQYVADKIGIAQRKYSYIETGIQQLTAEVLVPLARLYGVSIDYLLCQTDCPQRYPKR